MEKILFSQVISLGTCHRHVTGHTKNEYKEQVKSRGNRKIFILIFTCENADIPYNFLYGASLVLHLCKRTCPTGLTRWFTSETFFFWNWRVFNYYQIIEL